MGSWRGSYLLSLFSVLPLLYTTPEALLYSKYSKPERTPMVTKPRTGDSGGRGQGLAQPLEQTPVGEFKMTNEVRGGGERNRWKV